MQARLIVTAQKVALRMLLPTERDHSGRRDQVPTKALGRTIMPTRTVASVDKVASAA